MSALPAFTFPNYQEGETPAERKGYRWLSLRDAAGELDVSVSTVRRWLEKGKLRSRLVTRGRRHAYYVLLPAAFSPPADERVSSIVQHLRNQVDQRDQELALREHYLKRQQEQIANLSQALARALAQLHGSGAVGNGEASPYEKYRAIARRRRLRLPEWASHLPE